MGEFCPSKEICIESLPSGTIVVCVSVSWSQLTLCRDGTEPPTHPLALTNENGSQLLNTTVVSLLDMSTNVSAPHKTLKVCKIQYRKQPNPNFHLFLQFK